MEVFCKLHYHAASPQEIMQKLPISDGVFRKLHRPGSSPSASHLKQAFLGATENKSKLIDYLILLKLLMEKKNMYFPNNFYVWWVSYLLPVIDYKLYKNIGLGKYYRHIDINSFVNAYNVKYKLFPILNKKYTNMDNIYIEIFCNKIVNNNCIKNLDDYHDIYESISQAPDSARNHVQAPDLWRIDEKSPIFYTDYIVQIKINFVRKIFFIFSELIDSFIFEIPILKNKTINGQNKKINEYIKNYEIFVNEINHLSENNEKSLSKQKFQNKNQQLLLFDKFNNDLFNNFYPIINNDYVFSSPIKKLIYLDLYKKVINRI
jgi:hypothetical protein